MPCFLVGTGTARTMALAHAATFYAFSHQQGHIAAAVYSAGRLSLLREPFLAWHLSGGTTELLLVRPDETRIIYEEIVGGTTDISAGAAYRPRGVSWGLGFPAGRALASLAAGQPTKEHYKVRCTEAAFSLSGRKIMYGLVMRRDGRNLKLQILSSILYFLPSSGQRNRRSRVIRSSRYCVPAA